MCSIEHDRPNEIDQNEQTNRFKIQVAAKFGIFFARFITIQVLYQLSLQSEPKRPKNLVRFLMQMCKFFSVAFQSTPNIEINTKF